MSNKKGTRRGLMLVISSPSGAGKSTLADMLIRDFEDVSISVSATTRPPRPKEQDGVHYHFVDPAAFKARIDKGDFLEWASVFDHAYGTPKANTVAKLERGEDVVFDVDWQGADALHDQMPNDVVSVFVLPPSIEALENRLAARLGSTPEIVTRRMRDAKAEIKHWRRYDYCIINDDLNRAYDQLRQILLVERTKRLRQLDLDGLVRDLLA